MKPIKEIYPPSSVFGDDYFYISSDYGPMLESMGYEIMLKVDDEDYQGDSRILFKNGNARGILIFGWGSCSGCDALQACESYEEVEELRDNLHRSIKWFDSAEDCLNHMETHDWELQFSWHCDEMKEFLTKAKKMLKEEIK